MLVILDAEGYGGSRRNHYQLRMVSGPCALEVDVCLNRQLGFGIFYRAAARYLYAYLFAVIRIIFLLANLLISPYLVINRAILLIGELLFDCLGRLEGSGFLILALFACFAPDFIAGSAR